MTTNRMSDRKHSASSFTKSPKNFMARGYNSGQNEQIKHMKLHAYDREAQKQIKLKYELIEKEKEVFAKLEQE